MRGGDASAKACSRTRALPFDYSLDYDRIDFREQRELYRIGRGEQGVLLVEPYKSELLPQWRFRTPEVARGSADTIFSMVVAYLDAGDFVGADMARKFPRWALRAPCAMQITRAVASGSGTGTRCCRMRSI